MNRRRVFVVGVALSLIAAGVSAQAHSTQTLLPATTRAPDAFGTQDYTVTTISALSFSGASYFVTAPLSRVSALGIDQHFYATLDIPAGVVIDFIGINNLNDGTPLVLGVVLWIRSANGNTFPLAVLDAAPHTTWATDFNSIPINQPYPGSFGNGNSGNVLVLDINVAPSPNSQFLGWVEVWWRRTVSPAPATADFTDVPTFSPQFQFVEALYHAGITAGCGGGNYCPNAPLTRGQMAVFLSKALGLHWPQ